MCFSALILRPHRIRALRCVALTSLFGLMGATCRAQELKQFHGLPSVDSGTKLGTSATTVHDFDRPTVHDFDRPMVIFDFDRPGSAEVVPSRPPPVQNANATNAVGIQHSVEQQLSLPNPPQSVHAPQLANVNQTLEVRLPWWTAPSMTPLRLGIQSIPMNLDGLFALTAKHSGRVQAVAQSPWISQSQLDQAQAAFDPTLFSDNRFNSTSDPVENTLTTGGPSRLEDNIVSSDSGLRGENQSGMNYRVGQRFGHKNSNSNFFSPQDQGTARLYANLRQPLMRGRNIDVNRSLVLTTRFETAAAEAQFRETIQKQLFQVADAYWSLYTERVSLLQRQQHLVRAKEIAELLFSREGYDSSSSLIQRARSTIANRTADLAQADARIRGLEANIRALTNAPELTQNREAEFLPMQTAQLIPIHFDLENAVGEALSQRPEISEVTSKLEAAKVRSQLAKDQTKPTLDLVAEGYVAGLQGQSEIFTAFGEQFSEGRPGYAAGFVYERPIGARAARAAVRQRGHEIAQLSQLLVEATESIRAEVETAVRNVEAAKQTAIGRQLSLEAVTAEVAALQDRWKLLGNDPQLGRLQLDDLLSSQDRLLQEEQNYLQALVQYNRTILEVQRATGALIRFAN